MKRNILASLMVACLALVGCQPGPEGDRIQTQDPQKPADAHKPPQATQPPANDTKKPVESASRFELSIEGMPEILNWKSDPSTADVNKDGNSDFAAIARTDESANIGTGPHVWFGNGEGAWQDMSEGLAYGAATNQRIPSCGGGVGFADVNGDGNLDLTVADHCQGIYVYTGDGEGNWEMVTRALHPVELVEPGWADEYLGAECLAVGDINEDGNQDIIAGSSDMGGINLYLGDGTGANWTWTDTEVLPRKGWALRIRLVDMNDDGHLDVVANYSKGPRVWLGDGKGGLTASFKGLPTPLTEGIFYGLDVADANADGRPDVAVANWFDGPVVYLQQADGSFMKTPDVFPRMLGGAHGIDLGDMDGDGHMDILVSGRLKTEMEVEGKARPNVGYVYGVFFLKGDGKGGWKEVRDCGLPATGLSFTWGISLVDFDNDGDLDVLATSGGIVGTSPDKEARKKPLFDAHILAWKNMREE